MIRIRRPSTNPILRLLTYLFRSLINAICRIDYFFSSTENQMCVFSNQTMFRKVAIYACYMEVDANDERVISTLENSGWDVITVINGSDGETLNNMTFSRVNKGYDFGAFRDAIRSIQQADQLLLINSSMYWNISKFEKILVNLQMEKFEAIATYLTESLQTNRHGQSFFLHFVFHPDSFTISHLKEFFQENIRNTRFKRTAVLYGEYGIYKFLEEKPIRISFICEYNVVVKTYLNSQDSLTEKWVLSLLEKQVPLNPTQHLWWAAFDCGLPGIKKSLVKFNPAGVKFQTSNIQDRLNLK